MICNKQNILNLLDFIKNNIDTNKQNKIIITASCFRYTKEIFEEFQKTLDNNWIIKKDIDKIAVSNSNNKLKLLFLTLGDGSKIRGQRANLILVDDRQIDLEICKTIERSQNCISKNPTQQESKTKTFHKFPKCWNIYYDFIDQFGYNKSNFLIIPSNNMEEAINILKEYSVIKNHEIIEIKSCELINKEVIFKDN